MAQQENADVTAVKYSFVAPVYNEVESLPGFYQRLREVAEKLAEPYEIIFVDDGSTDGSARLLRRLREEDDHVRYVELSRNFGKEAALAAGLNYAAGAAVITLDSDGQHPPEMVVQLIGKWREGYEVVYAVRTNTLTLPRWKRWAGTLFYGAFKRLTKLDVTDQADFCLLDRKAVAALRGVREKARFFRGLVGWVGFRQLPVPYESAPREAGRSGFPLRKLADLGAAAIFNFSVLPLRLVGAGGLLMVAAALLYAVAALICWPILGAAPKANWVALAVGLLGVQLTVLGLLGEYIGKIYDEAKDRPVYLVREAVGFEPAEEPKEPARRLDRRGPQVEPSRIRLFT